MSISRMVYLRCDVCLNSTPGGSHDMRDSAAEARTVGRQYGWIRRPATAEDGHQRHGATHIDVCPDCAALAPRRHVEEGGS